MRSTLPAPLIASVSSSPSEWEICNRTGSPATVAAPPWPVIVAARFAPASSMRSALVSPPAVMIVAARLVWMSVTPADRRSPIRVTSAPLPGSDVERLDPGDVQRRGAADPQPIPVRREVERLVGVGPEDEHAVARAAAPVDPVLAVAGAPGGAVEVAAEVDDVVALAALHEVEVVPAEQHVVARAAEHRAAAVAGAERELHRRRCSR